MRAHRTRARKRCPTLRQTLQRLSGLFPDSSGLHTSDVCPACPPLAFRLLETSGIRRGDRQAEAEVPPDRGPLRLVGAPAPWRTVQAL